MAVPPSGSDRVKVGPLVFSVLVIYPTHGHQGEGQVPQIGRGSVQVVLSPTK